MQDFGRCIQSRLQQAQIQLEQVQRQVDDAGERVEQCHADYLQAGGERIEIIRRKLKAAQDKLIDINRRAASYQQIAAELKLDNSLQESVFNGNCAHAEQARQRINEEKQQAQDYFATQAAQLSNSQQDHKHLQQEISEIEARPDSNIDAKFQILRDEMADALGLARDQLMFIGELLDAHDNERAWQGAIERALGGLRTTLVVPESDFSLVTRWLNQRHTGLHVRVQVARALTRKAEFKHDGFLRKLIWHEHDYRDWLKQHLARFDLHCVDSTEKLDVTPFAITQQGLMQMEKGRFEKKDQHRIDDRRGWQLGFFQ